MSVNGINCVKGEIHNVLSLLRRNRRWSSEQRFEQEVPLQVRSTVPRAAPRQGHRSARSLRLRRE